MPKTPILQELAMPDKVLASLLTVLRALSHAEHEREAVRASLLFPGVDGAGFASQLEFCTHAEGLTIADTEEVALLAGMGNGFDGALVVHPDGRVYGTAFFSDASPPQDPMLPNRYWLVANASAEAAGLLILFAGEGDISLFHRGMRVLSHRQGTWHIHANTFDVALQEVESNGGPPCAVLSDALRLAFRLADQGSGALFTVGDHQAVLALATEPKADYVDWSSLNVADGDYRPLLAVARQDGATVIGAEGQIVKGMVYLHPPADTGACEEFISGSKHDTAAKVSAATRAATVAVSVNRRVSVFFGGNRLFRVIG